MNFLKTTLVLQQNSLSGLLIVLAMFLSHWTLGVSCFLGAAIGTLTAQTLRFPTAQIAQGLYGFNAGLAFMCALFTFGLTDAGNGLVWLLGALAAVVSTLIMRWFLKTNRVAFTFPFVLTCWVLCWGVAQWQVWGLAHNTPPLPEVTPIRFLAQPFSAWAQVNFGSSWQTGVILFFAIALQSPVSAAYAMTVAPIAALLAYYLFGIDEQLLGNGMYSFSAILAACAFAGTRFRDLMLTLLAVFLSVIVQHAVAATGLATYTIGFIISSWCVLWIKNRLDGRILNNKRV